MSSRVDRRTVDLNAFPDLVVIYLGMRLRTWAGIKTLMGLGPQIMKAGTAGPEGLLHFENNIIFSFFPLHVGMRWYWKDFDSMERWARSEPHRRWWQDFLRDSGGTGFQSVPGQVHPFSSVNPSGGRSGVGATGVAGLVLPKTLLWAGTFKGATTRLHTDNAARKSLLLSTGEFYQYSSE